MRPGEPSLAGMEWKMESVQPSVLTRDDTFFGVCEAIGEDFGFNPIWLRLGFALALFFNPVAAFGGYAAAGLVVAATRWLVREPRFAVSAETTDAEAPTSVEADNQMELCLAA
jgi:phage shock protein C